MLSLKEKKFQTRSKEFDKLWLSSYPWLRCDSQTEVMTYQVCIDHGKTNFFTNGCNSNRKRKDVLDEHATLPSHIVEIVSKKTKNSIKKC